MPRSKSDQPKKKRGFMDGYRTYDPEAEGFGSASEWRDSFNQRMGLNAAREALGTSIPRSVLGLGADATWNEIKKAWRRLVMEHHPDRGGDAARFIQVQAAYEVLAHEYGE